MTHHLSMKLLGGLAAMTFVSGCVSVLPEQPKPEAVYSLSAPETLARLETNVVIREPEAPHLFGGRVITSQSPDDGYKVVPDVNWADRATRMFQTTMLESFATDSSGLAVDDVTGVSAAYELFWRVSNFTLVGDEGHCKLQLTLVDGRNREPVFQDSVEARAPSVGTGPLVRAKALADAGRDCVQSAAQVIAENAVLTPVEEDAD
ncbi:ABC-type transport auxiliary lipoprotein family protein [Henriciella litoralis]|uniref:ABC-type transport auxiliary lipoprotein family protein n=1 Tax=Henriciella litoralis TaxID=568102 RepID=UPI000A01516F|nr:ABC-type transport auxiliary lipoprotein family protein [Henriciella litoralis]